jgi:hypothetical protein
MNCKNIFSALLLPLVFACYFSASATAQNHHHTNPIPVLDKGYTYEFSVTGLTSLQQAQHMDSTLTGKGGITKWETDFPNKKIKVTTTFFIYFEDIMKVCRHHQCEASEDYILKEAEQQ